MTLTANFSALKKDIDLWRNFTSPRIIKYADAGFTPKMPIWHPLLNLNGVKFPPNSGIYTSCREWYNEDSAKECVAMMIKFLDANPDARNHIIVDPKLVENPL